MPPESRRNIVPVLVACACAALITFCVLAVVLLPAKNQAVTTVISPAVSTAPVNPSLTLPARESEVSPAVSTPAPKAPDYIPLDMQPACNADVLGQFKRDSILAEGIPSDGKVTVPMIVPRAHFKLAASLERNAIAMKSTEPVVCDIPAGQRGHYGRLAILHGAAKGDAIVRLVLHYDSGEDEILALHVLACRSTSRHAIPDDYRNMALQLEYSPSGIAEFFAQIIKLDSARTLESLAFSHGGGNEPCILGLTAIISDERPFTDK